MFKQVFRGPLSETATVASQLGTPGEFRMETNGQLWQLLKAGSVTPIQPYAAVGLQSNDTTGYVAFPASVASHGAKAFYQGTVTMTSDAYFWGLVCGTGSVKQAAVIPVAGLGNVTTSGQISSCAATDAPVFKMLSSATTASTAPYLVGFVKCNQ